MRPPAARLRVVALISGRGSNLQVIAGQARAGRLPVEIRAVVSDRDDAPGIAWARSEGLNCSVLSPKLYANRVEYDEALAGKVAAEDPGLVILAGFMRILGPEFVDRYVGRMLNIHPSLLPLYPGLNTHARAIEAGDAEAGCTVHVVTEGVDEGPVLGQARVPILTSDTAETLAERVKTAEHVLYPQTLAAFVAR